MAASKLHEQQLRETFCLRSYNKEAPKMVGRGEEVPKDGYNGEAELFEYLEGKKAN